MSIWNLDYYFAFFLILTEFYCLYIFERSVEALVAISKNYTINELNNTWYYKYLFEVQKIDVGEKK
jgi:hypothetical protein